MIYSDDDSSFPVKSRLLRVETSIGTVQKFASKGYYPIGADFNEIKDGSVVEPSLTLALSSLLNEDCQAKSLIHFHININSILRRPDFASFGQYDELLDMASRPERLVVLPLRSSWKARLIDGFNPLVDTPDGIGSVTWWPVDLDAAPEQVSWSTLLWKNLVNRFDLAAVDFGEPIQPGMRGSEESFFETRRQNLISIRVIALTVMALLVKDGLTPFDPRGMDLFKQASYRLRVAVLDRVAARYGFMTDVSTRQEKEDLIWASVWNASLPPVLVAAHDRWLLEGSDQNLPPQRALKSRRL